MSTRSQLSETLNRLLPGESNKRIREAILAAASYSGQRTDQLRQQIDEANRIQTGLLVSGTITISSATSASLSGYVWAIDYAVNQPSGATTLTITVPHTTFSREDYFIGTSSGTIVYRAGTLDGLGNATPPAYNPATEAVLVRVVRNPGSNQIIPIDPANNLIDFVEQNIIPLVRSGKLVNSGIKALLNNLQQITGYQFPFPVKGVDGTSSNEFVTKSQLDTKENAFSKNTAFNKNFGTGSGTVAEGNDSRINNGQTAFSWGNHAGAGYAVLGTGTGQVRSNSQLDARYAAIIHLHAIADITGLQSALDAKLNTTLKGAANGLAELDANGKVPLSQINDSIIGQVEYKGGWNPSTNSPTLPTVPTEKGIYYVANADGTRFGLEFKTGDWIISNGTAWEKVDNTDAVSTVFGRTGVITAQESDYQSFYVRLGQTYSNPTWITSLAWSKLTGVPTSFTPSAHTHSISEVTSLQTALDGKEAVFSKNTAFNKNFGNAAGTVAEGNDSRINNGQTAFSWGNHASAGYALASGSNASGTWGINISGTAANANLAFNIASGAVDNLNTAWTAPGSSIDNGFRVYRYSFGTSNTPVSLNNANWLINIYSHPSDGVSSYGHQLAAADSENIYFRKVTNGSFGTWRALWHSGNFNPANYVPYSDVAQNGVSKVLRTTIDGYLAISNWIQIANNTGLFSIDGRYAYPNPTGYSGWRFSGNSTSESALVLANKDASTVYGAILAASSGIGFTNAAQNDWILRCTTAGAFFNSDQFIGRGNTAGASWIKWNSTGDIFYNSENGKGHEFSHGNVSLGSIRVAGITTIGTLTTGAPLTGSSGSWKLGVARTDTIPNANRLIRVEIGGVEYDILCRQVI